MTMKTPEMEVVRFSESDVIVASGPSPITEHRHVTITGLGTGSVGDATWTYTNGSTSVVNIKKYEEDKHNGTLNGHVTYYSGNDSTTLGDIVSGGDTDGLFTLFNGYYETLDEGASWHKVQ